EHVRVALREIRQLPAVPGVHIAPHQHGPGGRGLIPPLELCQSRRLAGQEVLELAGAHVGHLGLLGEVVLTRQLPRRPLLPRRSVPPFAWRRTPRREPRHSFAWCTPPPTPAPFCRCPGSPRRSPRRAAPAPAL